MVLLRQLSYAIKTQLKKTNTISFLSLSLPCTEIIFVCHQDTAKGKKCPERRSFCQELLELGVDQSDCIPVC